MIVLCIEHKAPPKCSGPLGSEEAIDGVSNGSGHVPKGELWNTPMATEILHHKKKVVVLIRFAWLSESLLCIIEYRETTNE